MWSSKEANGLDRCSTCDEGRYLRMSKEGRKIPRKQLIYFPIGPRLQHLYATKKIAENMRWCHDHKRASGVMAHPSNSKTWKHLDACHPSFAAKHAMYGLTFALLASHHLAIMVKHIHASQSLWPLTIWPHGCVRKGSSCLLLSSVLVQRIQTVIWTYIYIYIYIYATSYWRTYPTVE